MPFIETKTNVAISPIQEKDLKERLGKAIETIPGKSENWLMLNFQERCHLYFKGDGTTPAAFVGVKIFGSTNRVAFEKMTGVISGILQSVLGIEPDRVYVQYEACEDWGWNGGNF